MVEYFPKILASEEKATGITGILSYALQINVYASTRYVM